MFCKFCGKQIDKKTMQCVNCGKAVGPLEGGVGFWDLAGEKLHGEGHTVPPVNNGKIEKSIERIISRQDHMDKRITILSSVVVGVLICSFILNAILVAIALNLRKDHESITGYFQSQLEQENAHTEPQDTEPLLPGSEPFEETEQEVTTENTETVQAEASIIIVKQPEDVSVSEKVEAGAVLFSLKVEGENLTFHWKKYDVQTESWVDVDTNLFDVNNNEDSTETTLLLECRSEDIYGEFKCVITNADNESMESNTVEIYDPNLKGVE